MTNGRLVVLLACLASSACATVHVGLARGPRDLWPSFTECPDGDAVRLLIGRCPGGVCGYSCLPGRWD